jgi:DNA primase
MAEQTLINELNKLRKTQVAKEFKAPEMEPIPLEAMIPQEDLPEAGIIPGKPITESKDDRKFDFFRGRVMFPIHSISGKVLGFGGRTLKTEKKIAKYFNSPESIIYNKSKILYGLYFSKGAIIKNDNCYLVEGYTDVISMHQSGVENVVASSGTSLTTDQIKLIRRYTNNITILYDGDPAGIKASFRGIDLILQEGLNVKVILFPDGDDPDSYSRKVSNEELTDYLANNAKDFIAFKVDILLEEAKGDPIVKAKLIRDIVTSISLIPDQIIRSVYIKECASQFEMAEQTLINELNKLRKTKVAKEFKAPEMEPIPLEAMIPQEYLTEAGIIPGKPITESKDDIEHFQEFDLIRILIKYGKHALEVKHITEDNVEEFVETSVTELIIHELEKDNLAPADPLFAKIYGIFKEGIENQTLFEHTYFLQHQDPEIVSFTVDVISSPHLLSTQWFERHRIDTNMESDRLNQAVVGSIYSYKAFKVEKEINELRSQLKNYNDEEMDLNAILGRQIELEVVKGKLSEQTGRIILR